MLTKIFGFRLNAAGVFIGWVGVVGCLISAVLIAISLSMVDEIADLMVKQWPNVTVAEIHSVLVITFSIELALSVLHILASVLLIVGTNMERHLLLVPWLFNSTVQIIFQFLYTLYIWIMLFSEKVVFLQVLPSILLYSLTAAFNIYIVYGIYSLYKQIQATREEQRPLIPNQGQAQAPQPNSLYPNYTSI